MKYYRTVNDGHMQLWKTLAEIPKELDNIDHDAMEVPVDKDGLHQLLTDLLDRLFIAERTLKAEQALLEKHKIGSFYQENGIEPIQIIDEVRPLIDPTLEKDLDIHEFWDSLDLVTKLDLAIDAHHQARKIASTQSRNLLNDKLYGTKGYNPNTASTEAIRSEQTDDEE